MESFNSLLFFMRTAELGSFSAAGRKLGVSSSTVGKSVAKLEEKLGVSLFHRSTRSITLTNEGVLFLDRSRRILCEMEAAEQELAEIQSKPSGKLRISIPLIDALMMKPLIAFMHQYPNIDMEIVFTDRLVDVIEEGYDVVLRTGIAEDSRLVFRQLGSFKLHLVASPSYLEKAGMPTHPSDLKQHTCLQHKFPSTGKLEIWPLMTNKDGGSWELPDSIICNTSAALVNFAEAGLGIACLADFLVNEPIKQGRLCSVLPNYIEHEGAFYLLWPSSKTVAPKLRAFVDFMVAEFLKYKK